MQQVQAVADIRPKSWKLEPEPVKQVFNFWGTGTRSLGSGSHSMVPSMSNVQIYDLID